MVTPKNSWMYCIIFGDIIEYLIVASFNDAKKKSDDGSNDSIKAATGGIQLPAGFKF